jgi:hypothetical protein
MISNKISMTNVMILLHASKLNTEQNNMAKIIKQLKEYTHNNKVAE